MKTLYLVDVSSLFFRAFYAIRPLSSPSGLPTNAIYGFLSMVLKLLREEKPDLVVFCYDQKEPSFRKDIYPEYKANRTETPEDLIPQIPYIRKVADLLGIPSFEVQNFEADDLIGTMTYWGLKNAHRVYIVSGDKDFGQLVQKNVWLFDTMKGVKYDEKGVQEKWGVRPDQFVDYLALIGDASDNIPGVAGIGPKTAEKLLSQYNSLDQIFLNIETITPIGLKEKLKNGKDSAFLSKKLVQLTLDVQLPQGAEYFQRRDIQYGLLAEFLQELNFKNLGQAIASLQTSGGSKESAAVVVPPPTEISLNPERGTSAVAGIDRLDHQFSDPLEELDLAKFQVLFKRGDRIWCLWSNQGLIIATREQNPPKIFRLQGALDDWGRELGRMEFRWSGFDLKNLWKILKIDLDQNTLNLVAEWDSMLAAYLIKPGESMEWENVFARFVGDMPGDLLDPRTQIFQNLELERRLKLRLSEIQGNQIFQDVDLPLASILFKMENRGIRIDPDLLKTQGQELATEIKDIESKIYTSVGSPFNISSPKQLGNILFDKLGLQSSKKTKTGFSTDSDVLEKLKDKHEIVKWVLEFRELTKLKSTYVDALPTLIGKDGRLRSTFKQALTTTGRLSSQEPNLQNIPIRTERGARVRRAFVAAANQLLLSVDYSQIELRILAHFSGDKNLCQAFRDDLDIHAATAAQVFEVNLKEVTSDMRRTAKAVNFGIAYGQGAFGLAENLGISRKEGQLIIDRYFAQFPGVQEYMHSSIERAKRDGFVETLSGRRRYLDEFKASQPAVRKFAERAAINAPIQGTASDIVKMAMIHVDRELSLPLILQVHDELIFEGPEELLKKGQAKLKEIMENVMELKVPLKVNIKIGKNWDEAH